MQNMLIIVRHERYKFHHLSAYKNDVNTYEVGGFYKN
jgi:hypothetical protein